MVTPPYAPNSTSAPRRHSSLPFSPSAAQTGSRIRETPPRIGKLGLKIVTRGAGFGLGVLNQNGVNSGNWSSTCVIGAVGTEIAGAACAATGTIVAAAATASAAVPT